MHSGHHFIPIWFFIGSLLLIYGVLILGAGIYALISPPAETVVLAKLHADLWWGVLLVAIGAFYTIHFRPKKSS